MKILFLGDSITEGIGASSEKTNYVNRVRDLLGCEVVNYGLSGTRIGRQIFVNKFALWNLDFRLRTEIMCEGDMVFVFGGTNDYGHGRLVLGTPQEKEKNTFCNELRLLITELLKKYGQEKLCFILPIRRYDEEGVCCKGENGDKLGATLGEYVEAMRVILTEYGIDFLDLYTDGIPKPLVDTGDEYTVDGVHPNDKGYELIAKKICEYLRMKGEKQ